MSYSVTFIGKPEAVKRALDKTSNELTGQSKEEFDAVKPALETIMDQQVGNGIIKLNAYGHANIADGKKTFGNCGVEIAPIGMLVE